MKKVIFIIFLSLHSCISLNNVHQINTYEIKEGKPNSKKEAKKYTRYIFTNDNPHQIIIKYLEEKYKDKAFNKSIYKTKQKLFLDENIQFNLTFVLYTKQQRYLDLFNLFLNKDTDQNDPYYNKKLDDPVQEGDNIRYVSITITDDSGVDYLAKNSPLRDRMLIYLKELKKEYEIYKKNYNFINGQ